VVYRALLDPAVHDFNAHEVGLFRISLTYDALSKTGKSSPRTDTYHGHVVRLLRDEQVVEISEFETSDVKLHGRMTITTTLTDTDGGTDVRIVHEGIPDGVPAADNETGTRMALANITKLVEGLTHRDKPELIRAIAAAFQLCGGFPDRGVLEQRRRAGSDRR
jgi:hypothetical protein